MPFGMKQNEPFDPLPIRRLRAAGIMMPAHDLPHLLLQPRLGVGYQLRFRCGFSKFHIFAGTSLKRFSTKGKVRNKVERMEKLAPHRAVEEQC